MHVRAEYDQALSSDVDGSIAFIHEMLRVVRRTRTRKREADEKKTNRFRRPSALLEPHTTEQSALERRHPRDLTADIDRAPCDRVCVPRRPHPPPGVLDLLQRRVVRQATDHGLERRRHRDTPRLGTIWMQVDGARARAGAAHPEKSAHPARVVAVPVREDHGLDVVHWRLHCGRVADDGLGVGSGVEENEVFVLTVDLRFLSIIDRVRMGKIANDATYDQGRESVSP